MPSADIWIRCTRCSLVQWAARMRSIFEVEEDSHAKKAVLRL